MKDKCKLQLNAELLEKQNPVSKVRDGIVVSKCLVCGKVFLTKESKKKIFCSVACAVEYNNVRRGFR